VPKSKNPPRDAATVIIVRNRDGEQYELFLMRRHSNQSFMGGAFVFPGGRLDEADCEPDLGPLLEGLANGLAGRLLMEPGLPENRARGLFVAALRETFEETGVILARDAAGTLLDLARDGTADRYRAHRRDLQEGRTTFPAIARREGIRLAVDRLVPYARWITPDIESKRFDTRFFLARLPGGQAPVHDNRELTESRWIAPGEALRLHAEKAILLMPPTLKTMEELNRFRTADELFATARSREIRPILPQPFSVNGAFGVLLPHDPQYAIPGCRQPERPGDPSRIVMEDGVWKTR
jgi:8-oxo-dGTP pyrophosphatase MutT (NUDIX family)